MLLSGVSVLPSAPVAERRLTSGDVRFEDGSVVDVKKKKSLSLTAITSFYRADGTLYSLVRLGGEGMVEVQVTPGSGFETVAPSLVARVWGTEFTVETEEDAGSFGAEVAVTKGRVEVNSRGPEGGRGKGQELAPGQSAKIKKPKKN